MNAYEFNTGRTVFATGIKGITSRLSNFSESLPGHSPLLITTAKAIKSFKIPAMKRYVASRTLQSMYDHYSLNILAVNNFYKSFGWEVALGQQIAPLQW
jgi:hypothetical protein